MPLDNPDREKTPLESIAAKLAGMDEMQRAGAVAALAETIAERAGLDLDMVLEAHRRRGAKPRLKRNTPWARLPPLLPDTFGPETAGRPGQSRCYQGATLIIREWGRSGLRYWYATVNGDLVLADNGTPFFRTEKEAKTAAKETVDAIEIVRRRQK